MENNVETKEKMLLHSCCSVCSSHVISVLAPEYDLSVFYYNPNIWPEAEYEHRKAEQIRLLREADFCEGVGYFDLDYDHSEFLASGLGWRGPRSSQRNTVSTVSALPSPSVPTRTQR